MLLKRIWRVVRSGGDQQIGRRHRCRRLEMMLEKPDLSTPMRSASSTSSSWRRNIYACVEFSRGVVVDQMASLTVSSFPGSSERAPHPAAVWS